MYKLNLMSQLGFIHSCNYFLKVCVCVHSGDVGEGGGGGWLYGRELCIFLLPSVRILSKSSTFSSTLNLQENDHWKTSLSPFLFKENFFIDSLMIHVKLFCNLIRFFFRVFFPSTRQRRLLPVKWDCKTFTI